MLVCLSSVFVCMKDGKGETGGEMPNQLMCVCTMWQTEGEVGRQTLYLSFSVFVCVFSLLSYSRSKLRNGAGDGADAAASTCVCPVSLSQHK